LLTDYRRKRNFKATSEPSGDEAVTTEALTFVIQEHHASHLHWDFRLECDGVLKSWAVPKGPSTDPSVKRLAVMVEDHPLSYGSFEGTIPSGEYGAGKVKIWDSGTYAPDEPTPIWDDKNRAEAEVRKGLKEGKLSFTLRGQRLRGSWALVRLAKDPENWLLIKHHEESEQVTLGPQETIEPMLAGERKAPFDDKGWAFEPKLDGVRALAYVDAGHVRLISRGSKELTARFPEVTTALGTATPGRFVADGELVAFRDSKPDFQLVMDAYHGAKAPVAYYIFDLLSLDGESLRSKPYSARRKALESLNVNEPVRIIESFPESGKSVFQSAVELGFEGIVAKRLASKYDAGHRSDNWLKIKRNATSDFVVCGWTEGDGSRSKTFGSLVLAEQDGKELHFRGLVGTGFTDRSLTATLEELRPLEVKTSPFDEPVEIPGRVHWVRPKRRAEVRFHAMTRAHRLRAPVFIKLRTELEKPTEMNDDQPHPNLKLDSDNAEGTIEVDGAKVHLTHLDKPLWPPVEEEPALTKRDFAEYFLAVAPFILPHLKGRPVAFVRYPDGAEHQHFFQKHLAPGHPEFLRTVPVFSEHNRRAVDYLLVENRASLLWLAQMAALELHPWQSRVDAEGAGHEFDTQEELDDSVLNRPDCIVFDLDPYTYSGKEAPGAEPELNRTGWDQAVTVATHLNQRLGEINLKSFVKTSGKTGLHIFVPILPEHTYEEVRAAAKALGDQMMRELPNLVTMQWSVKKRPAKVFFDFGQNAIGKTVAAIYSPRPTPGACVSFPVRWSELKEIYPTDFTIRTVPGLLKKDGDLWANIWQTRQSLIPK
jgi:bifunctional non-homologous end joining protein LigD